MTPLSALIYSLFFGLLHGILPDEHTWPITFSYAIGGASGREGMKAGLYFSAAFTLQRALISELAYLALAPFLLNPAINGVVYLVVGIAMSVAGAIVLRKNRYVHIHLFGHCHGEACNMEQTGRIFTKQHEEPSGRAATPPVQWTVIHGFLAGFGFGGFSLFVNTVAAPAMKSPWAGFLPGLVFGLGTMIMLVIVGGVFGASLRWIHALTEEEIKRIGSQTGGRTLFFGGILFGVAGVVALTGLDRYLPFASDYAFITLFMIMVAIPALMYSVKEVLATRKLTAPKS
ncbi:MAG: sulfite exporter TauE/SafE family protein [Nitrospiraceae bacterium]|nr:sulfite exporter TauE/SafE family protein [Nitrospiraceae bacterium]